MRPLLSRLENYEILVADGAMGSLLINRGLQPGECPELFNISSPKVLEEIAILYINAGADIIQTNTFGGSPMKLSDYGLQDQCEEINAAAVKIVKDVVNSKRYVSGSCGPSGKMLEPYGDAKPEELYSGFQRQIGALVNAGVDIICIETMIDLTEAVLAVKAAKAVSSQVPVMATMTFEKTPRGFYTIMGINVEDAANGLEEAGTDIIGSNCGNGIENMVGIAQEFRKVTKLPLIFQANAGQPTNKDGKLEYNESADFFAENAKDLIEAGASIIGGCCGTTPEHIQAIRKLVDQHKVH